MKNVIRLGDPTSHGGTVVSVAATHILVGGKPVACVGDQCICPLPGHGPGTIVKGSATHIVEGNAVAYHGHTTSCGAELIATVKNFGGE